MKIEIKKAYIYDEVAKLCAYIGAKGGEYEKVSVTGDDTILFDEWWNDACGDIIFIMKRWITGFSPLAGHHDYFTGGTFAVELYAPHLGGIAGDRILSASKGYLINRVASMWLAVTSPDKSGKYAANAVKNMADLNNIIYYRKKIKYEED